MEKWPSCVSALQSVERLLSIAGNLVFTVLFLDTLPVNFVAANVLAIAVCSILNYIRERQDCLSECIPGANHHPHTGLLFAGLPKAKEES